MTKDSTYSVSVKLQNLAKLIDNKLQKIAGGQRIGFSLIIYTSKRANYISNIDRNSAIPELEKMLNHWKELEKNNQEDIPAHEVH